MTSAQKKILGVARGMALVVTGTPAAYAAQDAETEAAEAVAEAIATAEPADEVVVPQEFDTGELAAATE